MEAMVELRRLEVDGRWFDEMRGVRLFIVPELDEPSEGQLVMFAPKGLAHQPHGHHPVFNCLADGPGGCRHIDFMDKALAAGVLG